MKKNAFDILMDRLPRKEFLTPKEISESGIYSTPSAVYAALRRGDFPAIRISPYKILINRKDYIEAIRKVQEGKYRYAS